MIFQLSTGERLTVNDALVTWLSLGNPEDFDMQWDATKTVRVCPTERADDDARKLTMMFAAYLRHKELKQSSAPVDDIFGSMDRERAEGKRFNIIGRGVDESITAADYKALLAGVGINLD